MNQENNFIDNVEFVLKEIKEKLLIEVKAPGVRMIMKEDLGMSYRKIHPVPWHANSEKNLILRQ